MSANVVLVATIIRKRTAILSAVKAFGSFVWRCFRTLVFPANSYRTDAALQIGLKSDFDTANIW